MGGTKGRCKVKTSSRGASKVISPPPSRPPHQGGGTQGDKEYSSPLVGGGGLLQLIKPRISCTKVVVASVVLLF